jgi:beta-N-acetylhexosaminidase
MVAQAFLKSGRAFLHWLFAFVLLGLAWNLKDPHLWSVRALEIPVLLVLAACGVGLALRRPPGPRRVLLLTLLVAAVGVGLAGEIGFRYRKHAVLSAEAALGRHFIVGYDKLEEVQPLVAKGLVGGIFITQRNAAGKSMEELGGEIAHLQALRRSAGLPPLLVSTDQEGGPVSRLSPPLEKQPPLAALVAESRSEEELERKAEAYGAQQGAALAKLGVTINFSPVVDLKVDRGEQRLDFHSLIARRAISPDPRLTARVALAYVRGLERHQVKATLKHFPGLGGVASDTHHFSAVLDTPIAELRARDWLPFQQVAAQSSALVMLGHVVVAELDRQHPASFSRTVVQTVIRSEWRYDGVLITDDLTMGAAYNRGLCAATLGALNAGVDLLLVSYDHEKYYEAMHCAAKAYREGRLSAAMLGASRRRLERLR